MRCQITQYGLSKKAGGWDDPGDSETDQRLGGWGNLLMEGNCALTKSVINTLGIMRGEFVRIEYPDGYSFTAQFADIAPESDDRCDIFHPFAFSKEQDARGDFADVTISGRTT